MRRLTVALFAVLLCAVSSLGAACLPGKPASPAAPAPVAPEAPDRSSEIERIAGFPVKVVLDRDNREGRVDVGEPVAVVLEEDESRGKWFYEVDVENAFEYVDMGTYRDARGKTSRVWVLKAKNEGDHFLFFGLNSPKNEVLERLQFPILMDGQGASRTPGGGNPLPSRPVTLPPFEGPAAELDYRTTPRLTITAEKWAEAKRELAGEHKTLAAEIDGLEIPDFALLESWEGKVKGTGFQMDIYSYYSDFLLTVSRYGDSGLRVRLSLNFPLRAFVFYGESVYLASMGKGIGLPFNIVTGELGGVAAGDFESHPLDGLAAGLNGLNAEQRKPLSRHEIAGYRVTLIRDCVVAVSE